MIDVKEAVRLATDYIKDLYDERELEDLTLEEVELSEDEQWWLVTLGHARRLSGMDGFGGQHRRCLRVFSIRADSGQVQSMKIRD
ncbi:MAG: hypothetical protein ACOCXJ_07080 [Planctomycetota bacterium]